MLRDDSWQILTISNPAVVDILENFDSCTFFSSIDDAVCALNDRRVDLVVMHQKFDHCSEYIRKIRHTKTGTDLPIVVIGEGPITDDCLVECVSADKSPACVHEKIRQFARIGRRMAGVGLDANKEELLVQSRHRIDELEHYLYCATHDLKSPLMTFVGYLSHIRHDLDSGREDRIPRFINTIENTAKRMRNVINDMLELCRVGHVTVSFDRVDVALLIRNIALEHQSQLLESGVSLVVESEMPTVQANNQLIRQLFENLLANAIKYGREANNPCVKILYSRHGDEHRFCVRDNGPGIDPQYHDRIFDLFQRLDNKEVNGTGVGLTLVRRIAECHRGRVWVDSEPGKGAAFWLAIPVDQEDSEHLNAA